MLISADQLRELAPNARAEIVAGIVAHQGLFARYGITTPLRLAHAVAQLAHESGGFRALEENLNYSASALHATFRAFRDPADCAAYARQPERIANRAYAGRLGNGDEASGDGWRYRGRGLIQLTGRENYRRIGAVLGLPLEAKPEIAAAFPAALETALFYWRDHGCNVPADRDDIDGVTRKINPALTGIADRRTYLARAKSVWVDRVELSPDPGAADPHSTDYVGEPLPAPRKSLWQRIKEWFA